MFTIIVFAIILGFLVFVHEIGHFLVAKRNGIKADEFGLGFPPRAIGVVKDDDSNKWKVIRGNKEVESPNTIYSLNWIPIGGFVKIKGQDGEEKREKDSFAHKSAWTRTKVLAAGVIMNFVFAWILLSIGFMLGVPQEVTDNNTAGAQIVIQSVEPGSPAEKMGLKGLDEINKSQIKDGKQIELNSVPDVQNFINEYKNKNIDLLITRSNQKLKLSGVPQEGPEGKGRLGISLAQVTIKQYSFFPAFKEGLIEIGNIFMMIGVVVANLFKGQSAGIDATGPIGIAIFTGQVIPLGFAYILRFAAILSINLGIINALPFPALDGGRILFILIEKIKGSPVNQKVEQAFHTIGFLLLMLLMVVVTYNDIIKFNIIDKIKSVF